MHGQAKNKETSLLYDVNKYSILTEISSKEKDSFYISSLVGVSLVRYATNTCLNGGVNIGVQANYSLTKKISIGAKVIQDFNTNTIDRFTQVNVFVRLKI